MNSETPIPQPQDLNRGPHLQDATEPVNAPQRGQGEPANANCAPPHEIEDPLSVSWEMFHSAPWQSRAQFVAAFNARFGLRRAPQHFATQFVKPWKRDLGIPGHVLARLMRLMRLRQGQARAAKYARTKAATPDSSVLPPLPQDLRASPASQ